MERKKSRKECRSILGVGEEATQDEIKVAYRRAAKTCHPDVNKNDPEANKKFINVKEAYEELQKPEQIPIRVFNRCKSPFSRAEDFYQQQSFSNIDEVFDSVFSSSFRDPFFERVRRKRDFFEKRVRRSMDPFERIENKLEELIKRFFHDFW